MRELRIDYLTHNEWRDAHLKPRVWWFHCDWRNWRQAYVRVLGLGLIVDIR